VGSSHDSAALTLAETLVAKMTGMRSNRGNAMTNAHDAGDAYRKEVRKTLIAYREEVGRIIQEIPPQLFARLADLTPNARDAVLSVIHNAHTSITGPDTPGHRRRSPDDLNHPRAQQIDEGEALRQLDELHQLLVASSRSRGS
jgi:hypothetical protein